MLTHCDSGILLLPVGFVLGVHGQIRGEFGDRGVIDDSDERQQYYGS